MNDKTTRRAAASRPRNVSRNASAGANANIGSQTGRPTGRPSNGKRSAKRRRRPNPLLLLLTAAVTLFALWKLGGEVLDKTQSRALVEEMRAQAVQTPTTEPTEIAPDMEFAPITVDFEQMWQSYPDLVAWLYCPGTSLNYPVVQTDNNQFYVSHLPNGQESASGALFVDCTNSYGFADANTLIYGHDMKDGSMFGNLHNYSMPDYYSRHKDIYLLTPGQNYRMEILTAAVVSDDSWVYEMKMDEARRKTWALDAHRLSLVGTQATADLEAEHYLTLSTCSYEYENARFVLIGSLKEIY